MPGPAPSQRRYSPPTAAAFAVAGWFVPGLGHLLAGRWGRGAIFFVIVVTMLLTGFLQRGFVFTGNFKDAFGLLGFLADIGNGVLYFTAKLIETAGPDTARASGDYGTRFVATAGVLNLLTAFDAYAVAIGEKD